MVCELRTKTSSFNNFFERESERERERERGRIERERGEREEEVRKRERERERGEISKAVGRATIFHKIQFFTEK